MATTTQKKKYQATPEQKELAKAKAAAIKADLIALSGDAKLLKAAGVVGSVNDGLRLIYSTRDNVANDFRTFAGWLSAGYAVKKGAKGYTLWSAPKEGTKELVDGTEKEYKFWSFYYAFSLDQVELKG
jgi:hypothetical protein